MNTPLTTAELAEKLGVDKRTIQRWARNRTIPHMRIGSRTIRFLPTHVEQILEAYEREVEQRRPEADVPNDTHRPYITIVPMRRPHDAA